MSISKYMFVGRSFSLVQSHGCMVLQLPLRVYIYIFLVLSPDLLTTFSFFDAYCSTLNFTFILILHYVVLANMHWTKPLSRYAAALFVDHFVLIYLNHHVLCVHICRINVSMSVIRFHTLLTLQLSFYTEYLLPVNSVCSVFICTLIITDVKSAHIWLIYVWICLYFELISKAKI